MYKILIVEDSPVDSELLRRTLVAMDDQFNVRTAGSGEKAWLEIKNDPPDLILLDLYLSDQDGFKFIERINKEIHQDIPILLVSTFSNNDDRLKGLQLGATDFINKPIIVEEMKARITSQLRLKKVMDDHKWAAQKTEEGIRLLYKELEVKNKELKALDQLKDDFINNVSHELRTPLTIIRESISQIVDGLVGSLNERQSQFLGKSLTNIDRLKKIIDDLLDIAKIEQGKLRICKEKIHLDEVIEEVANNFTLPMEKKGLQVKTCIPRKGIEIYADKERIIQVLTNLVNNAYKFTNEGRVNIHLVEHETAVECSVQDTGVGISSDDLPKVFSKFVQFGRQHGPGEKGTGLGLAIAKWIVELHNGKMEVSSVKGEGTKITFSLPKYSFNEAKVQPLFQHLKDKMRFHQSYSVLAFSIEGVDKKELYNSWETLFEKQLYRESDKVIMGDGCIYIVLPDTDKKKAVVVARRISQMLELQLLFAEKPNRKYSYKIFNYPEDALGVEDLIIKLELEQGELIK